MPRYLLVHRSAPTDQRQAPSPAQMQEMYAAFQAWKDRFADRIVDLGAKLTRSGRVVSAAGVTDGPFVEVKEVIGGYMVVEADSYDGAVEVARGIPGMSPGVTIEVREIASP